MHVIIMGFQIFLGMNKGLFVVFPPDAFGN